MDKYIIEKYGAGKLNKVRRNMKNGAIESKRRLTEKYPGADFSKFEFQSELNDNGDIDKYTVFYKINDTSSYDITSEAFLNNKEWVWYLYQWNRIWNIYGTTQPYVKNSIGTSYKINSFRIYVNNDQFFDIDFPKFDIADDVFIDDIDSNSHLASVFASYIATYSCGISTEHLTYSNDIPKIITSIARYHLYYHMKRFISQPSKMKRYITKEIRSIIMGNKPIKYEWVGETRLGYLSKSDTNRWLSTQAPNSIRNLKHGVDLAGPEITFERRQGGTIGGNLDDYKLFIATKSNGLTKTGQLLLQQSIESYVYCMLGAQAKTRWPIIGRGAMSIQTQSVFLRLVSDTVAQDNQTIAVSNMRKAIKDTNVILNMAISPGIILIPSDMTILTVMVSGYNNILTLAGKGMKFGMNSAVNYLSTDKSNTVTESSVETKNTDLDVISDKPPSGLKDDLYILAVMLTGGVLISRYVI